MGLAVCGWCSTCASRYITWIEVSVRAGCRQGCTVIRGDCERIACMNRSVKHVGRTCEEISVCNAWEVWKCDSVLGEYRWMTVNRYICEINVCVGWMICTWSRQLIMYNDAVNVFPHLAGYVTTWRVMLMEVWLPMSGRTCLCCGLVGILHISLYEIVTWRVLNDSILWWSLEVAWNLS